MKNLLVAINAKYIHTNLAVRSIKEYGKVHYGVDMSILEFTINNQIDYILWQIKKQNPSILGFSCYIFNIEYVLKIAEEYKKISPSTIIILGGPEISFEDDGFLNLHKYIDYIVCGEGEISTNKLIKSLNDGELPQIKIIKPIPVSINDIGFCYSDIDDIENRIFYYESSRGCPFCCKYCLSSVTSGVKFKDVKQVFSELSVFIKKKVSMVKFVDRTFNADKNRAYDIFSFLISNYNDKTTFHFEISADLLDDKTINLLSTAPNGYFQFEIGIQSTNVDTISAISRTADFDKSHKNIEKILKIGNIHCHLDLIIGLPLENKNSVKKSFTDVYNLSPHMIQIGFLKLLKGSFLRYEKDKYGIVHRSFAPYEILYNNSLSYVEIENLKQLEIVFDKYYNSRKFLHSLPYLISKFENAFDFFEKLAKYFEANGYFSVQIKESLLYKVLYEFYGEDDILLSKIKLDMLLCAKIKTYPLFLGEDITKNYKAEIYEFYKQKDNIDRYLKGYNFSEIGQYYKNAHIEYFNICPISGKKQLTKILFNYKLLDSDKNAKFYILG